MAEDSVTFWSTKDGRVHGRGELKAAQLGLRQGNGDSGYQGRQPWQKGHLCSTQVLTGATGSHILYAIVQPTTLCMQ